MSDFPEPVPYLGGSGTDTHMNFHRLRFLIEKLLFLHVLTFCGLAVNVYAAPSVLNLAATQRVGTGLVDITYDLAYDGFGSISVRLEVSSDGGVSFDVPALSVSGAVGEDVTTGTAKVMTWDAGADWGGNFGAQVSFRVTADTQFAEIPGGSFVMGRTSGDSDFNNPPITVTVSSFYIQKTEITKEQWDSVREWALDNGYTDLPVGAGKAPDHPVYAVNWWDVVKWCNARSEKEGLTPCYTVSGVIYRDGTSDPDCDWEVDGYRLPTEAEWEKAARGGLSDKRFPSGSDTISHAEANFRNYGGESYSLGTTEHHPVYAVDGEPYTSPVGMFSPNGYGLRDMSGNIWEWCWDHFDHSYYSISNGATNPRGPNGNADRSIRGGAWRNFAFDCRAGYRGSANPYDTDSFIGFRPVRRQAPENFVEIPAGDVVLGVALGDPETDAPQTTVFVDSFYLQTTETTKAQWDIVRIWALENGYTDLETADGKAPDHPVHSVRWIDAVKWCNARSEMEGLRPCYYVGGLVLRTGATQPDVDWSANGYRLPTEAEWEKAARGGISGKRFPWGTDTITHAEANYLSTTGHAYDISPSRDTHPAWTDGSSVYTSPVGSFGANGYGLLDMSGNVWEWCWDRYGGNYYSESSGLANPRGPSIGTDRVLRGGSWNRNAAYSRNGYRLSHGATSSTGSDGGFRPARGRIGNHFATVPGGVFTMGQASGDEVWDNPPTTVEVSSFRIERTETTKAQWDIVRAWALNNGYTDLVVGGGEAPDHPVHSVSWYDIVKWCNARSEMEGLTPCYLEGGAVIRTGTSAPDPDWVANGYRLPTEAEWEKAARGGLSGLRFPWGDTISHSFANFNNNNGEPYASGTTGYHPRYNDGSTPYTSPVDSFLAHGYGVRNMTGNVWEFCWDRYGEGYYAISNGTTDPRGPSSGHTRVIRGGSWNVDATNCRSSFRTSITLTQLNISVGFRSVRDVDPFGLEVSDVTVDTRGGNSDLSALSLSVGELAPAFATATIAYSASVANAVSSVTVTPTLADSNAAVHVKINSGDFAFLASGVASSPLPLQVGENVIEVRTTAQNGSTASTYSVTVTRDKAAQIIDFAYIIDQLGTGSLVLTATGGSSGEPIVFSVASGPAAIGDGNILTFTGTGTVEVRASQSGDADFSPAEDVVRSFNVVLPQPDVAVGLSLGRLRGAGIYGLPSGQQLNLVSRSARAVRGIATLSNRTILSERRAADRIAVQANPGNRFFRITYSDVGGNATAGIVSGSYRTPAIDGTDAIRWLTARISPSKARLAVKKGKRTVYLRKVFTTTVRARSTLFPPASDSGVIRVLTR